MGQEYTAFNDYIMSSWLGNVGARGVRVVAVLVEDESNGGRRYNYCDMDCFIAAGWSTTDAQHYLLTAVITRPPEQGNENRWWWSPRWCAIAPLGTRCDYCGQMVDCHTIVGGDNADR